MNVLAVSMRVDIVAARHERRDTIDQRWHGFFKRLKVLPLFVPNNEIKISEFLKYQNIKGIVLTGGNDLVKYGGDAPERDRAERCLLKYALARRIPLVGICRGMQLIQDYFGVNLEKVSGHIATKHEIIFNNKKMKVNSYHTMGTFSSTKCLDIIGISKDGVVEAVKHVNGSMFGLMWHPERFSPYRTQDIKLFKDFFNL